MIALPGLTDTLLLVGAGTLAGFINTVAGGGSLLTLPALMLTGLDASVANGTNRVGVLFQSAAASRGFQQADHLPPGVVGRLALPMLAGAGLGAGSAAIIPTAALEPILLATLVAMALLLALRPKVLAPTAGEAETRPGPRALFELFGAGFYAGFLQAGVGFILLAVLAGRLRYDLARANALKVALVLPLTLVALGIFLWAGQVRWVPGLILAGASVVGALIGVRVAVQHTGALRWLVLAAVVVAALAVAFR